MGRAQGGITHAAATLRAAWRQAPSVVEIDAAFGAQDPVAALQSSELGARFAAAAPEFAAMDGFDQRNPWHREGDLGEHTRHVMRRVRELSADPDLVWVAALHDTGKLQAQWFDEDGWGRFYANEELGKKAHEEYSAEIAERLLAELGMPAARAARICHLIRHHQVPTFANEKSARRWVKRVGAENVDALLTFAQADWEADGDPQAEMRRLRELVAKATAVKERKCQLALGGSELIAAGMRAGPELGRALAFLEGEVAAGRVANERSALLARLAARS